MAYASSQRTEWTASPSIRSCSRARTNERGFALAMALILAVLYFGLIELMLYRRVARARGGAALSGAHRRARRWPRTVRSWRRRDLVNVPNNPAADDRLAGDDVRRRARRRRPVSRRDFKINGTGDATGIVEAHATVYVQGRVDAERGFTSTTRGTRNEAAGRSPAAPA